MEYRGRLCGPVVAGSCRVLWHWLVHRSLVAHALSDIALDRHDGRCSAVHGGVGHRELPVLSSAWTVLCPGNHCCARGRPSGGDSSDWIDRWFGRLGRAFEYRLAMDDVP